MSKFISTIILSVLLLHSTSAFADRTIAKFEGPNSKITRKFTVKPGWQIKYQTPEPAHFAVEVHNENGKYIALAVNEIGPKEGLYYQAKGGKFYLDVTSSGNWYIKVIQITK